MEDIIRRKIGKARAKIAMLKVNLRATDYMAIKYAEGEISSSEYAETKAKRKQWRTEINMYEEQIKALRG